MRCHYEVLGLPLDATVEDIKKAYRKLALEWHPDKNLHKTEEATETFQLIQQAYEVLIDPQERAWYDRNRDKILRGDEEYMDDHLDVYQYFNTSRFKGYGDDEKSFYTVYREVFEKIAAEDTPFMDEDIAIPSFGYSYSPYKEEVYPFYAYWQSYCTAKTYTWVDKYDLVEARKCAVGRQVIRCMERENKKLREQHRKMRNEEVRQLVAFVRKRDQRIENYKKHLEIQNAEKAKKAQEQRRKQIAERKKNLESYKETEWTSMSALERHLTEIEASLDNEFGTQYASDKDEDDSASGADGSSDLYCVACDKAFRSAKAMTNHQNSKKHKENVASLKEFMQDEDVDISDLGEEDLDNSDLCDDLVKNNEEQDIPETKQSASKKKKKKKKKPKDQLNDIDLSDVEDFLRLHIDLESANGCEPEALALKVDHAIENGVLLEQEEKDTQSWYAKRNKVCSMKHKAKSKQQVHKKEEFETQDGLDRIQLENKSHPNDSESSLLSQLKLQDSNNEEVTVEKMAKKSKGAQRKSKKKTTANGDEHAEQVTNACVKCGKVFGSRNKLFDHLKETGHSTYMSDNDRATVKLRKKRES